MTVDKPRPADRSSRFWPAEDLQAPQSPDGPVVLFKAAIAIGWRYKFRLIGCTVAGILLAMIYAYSSPRTYNATATILLEPRQFPNASTVLQQGLDLNNAESELQIILSERLLSAVFESLRLYEMPELAPQQSGFIKTQLTQMIETVRSLVAGSQDPAGADSALPNLQDDFRRAAFANFAGRVSARRVGQSYVVEVGYWSTDPSQPARVANALISGYILQSVTAKEQLARAGTETLQGRLDALAAQVASAEKAMRNGTLPDRPTPDADAKITGAALAPLGPSSPKTTLIVVFGGLLGLFCGMIALAFSVAFDRRVRTASDLKLDTTSVCLGSLPEKNGLLLAQHRATRRKRLRQIAALRDLRTAIDLSCPPRFLGKNAVIALASCSDDTGGSVLGINLAEMLYHSGRTVTLFCGDTLALEHRGQVALADAGVATTPVEKIEFDSLGGIAVLPITSRNSVTNQFCDFRHPRVREIIEFARSKGDVILDLPPLDTSMDALTLASHSDAVVLVTRWGHTTKDQVLEAEKLFRRASINLVGYVINRCRS